LAKKGFDVALAARTMEEGQGRDDGDFNPGRRIEGSLLTAAQAVESFGTRALPVRLDLLDPVSVAGCVETVLEEWGRVDVLVNNATLHTGSNIPLRRLTRDVIEAFFRANLTGPLELTIHALAAMEEQGGGRIITVTSAAGFNDPPAPPGEGGWGVLYGMVKAAQHRIPGLVRAEYGGQGILCFSLSPGFVKTPVIRELPVFRDSTADIPPTVPASVIAWLASSDEAGRFNCQLVEALEFAKAHGLSSD
jgi:hypothetical protein